MSKREWAPSPRAVEVLGYIETLIRNRQPLPTEKRMGAAIGVHCSTVGVALRDLAKHGAIKIMSIGQAKIITLPDGRATPWPEGIDGMELQTLEQAKVRKKRSRYDVSAVKVEAVRRFVAEHPGLKAPAISAQLSAQLGEGYGETTVKQALAVLRAAGAMTGERRAA